jgi:hypothetical protein
MKPATYSVGDTVKAEGRYKAQTVTSVHLGQSRPGSRDDGHTYTVSGGKRGRQTQHLSGQLRPFDMGTEEAT